MSDEQQRPPTLDEAEALRMQARFCFTQADAAQLKDHINSRLQAYVSFSASEHYSPAIYKTLQSTVKMLEEWEQSDPVRPAFSFTAVRTSRHREFIAQPVESPVVTTGTPLMATDPLLEAGVRIQGGTLYVSGVRGMDVVRSAEELRGVGTVILKNLERCRVVLLGVVETVYVTDVKESVVWIGVSRASAILHEVFRSTVLICCRQLRIANSVDCTFLFDSVTMPIIEGSHDIIFAKNHVRYPGFEEQLKASGLKDRLSIESPYATDFSWQHAVPSPNWCVVPTRPPVTLEPEPVDDSAPNEAGNSLTFSDASWAHLDSL